MPSALDDSAGLRTRIYSARGTLLGDIERAGPGEWYNGGTLECWVRQQPGGWYAGMTHNEDGEAVRASRNRWNMWSLDAMGRRQTFRGFAVRRSSTRWNIYSRKARFVAYTRGPDGGAAATSYLIMGICE